jgi:hypothetical protein
VRALLVARKLLLGKLCDVELSLRGVLRGFGLKMGHVTRKGFEARVRELCAGQAILEEIADAMLSATRLWTCPYLVESHCLLLCFVFELYGAFVAEGRMPADGIIKAIVYLAMAFSAWCGSWCARSVRI